MKNDNSLKDSFFAQALNQQQTDADDTMTNVQREVRAIDDVSIEYIRHFRQEQLTEIKSVFHCDLIFDRNDERVVTIEVPEHLSESAWWEVSNLLTDTQKRIAKIRLDFQRAVNKDILGKIDQIRRTGEQMEVMVYDYQTELVFVGPTQTMKEFLKIAEMILAGRKVSGPQNFPESWTRIDTMPNAAGRAKDCGHVYRAMSGGLTVYVWKCDITRMCVDVIVNAANDRLEHGGG